MDDNVPGVLASKIMDKIDSALAGSAVLMMIRCGQQRDIDETNPTEPGGSMAVVDSRMVLNPLPYYCSQ